MLLSRTLLLISVFSIYLLECQCNSDEDVDEEEDILEVYTNAKKCQCNSDKDVDEEEDILEVYTNSKKCPCSKWSSQMAALRSNIYDVLELDTDCDSESVRLARKKIDEAFGQIDSLLCPKFIFNSATESPINKIAPTARTTTTTTTSTTTTTTPKPTTTTTPKPTTTTTTTVKPIIYCDYNNEKSCVKRWNCKNQLKRQEKYLINLAESSVCHYLETCCSPENITTNTQKSYKTESEDSQCGFANNKGVYMTIEGNDRGESDFGEFPWTVAILFTPSNTYQAGGSLIAPNVVLTSGNYLNVNDSLKVRAGEWDMWTDNEFLGYQERAVNQIIVHPHYSLDTYENDIGLLILESSFRLRPHIRPICLSQGIHFDYGNCIVSGWNKVPRRGRLMVTKMPLSITNCTSDPKYESLLCVRGHSSNLKYALGSALVCPKANDSTNQYFQLGAWSYGSSVNKTRFANVPIFLDWINTELAKYRIYLS